MYLLVRKYLLAAWLVVLLLPLLQTANEAKAADVTLAWDANAPASGTIGYRLYWGTESRNYSNSVDVGNVLRFTITGLTEGVTYYFAATAYDASNNESGYSIELEHTIAISYGRIGEGSYIGKAETLCFPIALWQRGSDYESVYLPDGSLLFTIPNVNSGDRVKWSN